MSDFKITDKNGIKLKTANKYVTEDLAVTLTDDDINNNSNTSKPLLHS